VGGGGGTVDACVRVSVFLKGRSSSRASWASGRARRVELGKRASAALKVSAQQKSVQRGTRCNVSLRRTTRLMYRRILLDRSPGLRVTKNLLCSDAGGATP
jgi:hypothetical protein